MTQVMLYASLAVIAAVVLVLVVYLFGIIYALWSAGSNLQKLAGGLIAIRDNTDPLGEHMQAINGGLSALLVGLLGVNNNLSAIVKVAQRASSPALRGTVFRSAD